MIHIVYKLYGNTLDFSYFFTLLAFTTVPDIFYNSLFCSGYNKKLIHLLLDVKNQILWFKMGQSLMLICEMLFLCVIMLTSPNLLTDGS